MRAILRDADAGKWRLFERPRELVVARALSEVVPALQKIESECAKGAYAAGFIAYEAAPAFDPALRVQADGIFPLLWFGLYENFHELPDEAVERPDQAAEIPDRWTPSIDRERYAALFDTLQELIRSGETYQVNFTYRLTSHMPSSPWALFQHLVSAQNTAYGAYIHAGEWVVCSASPEMFFEKRGATIVSKPMKGTAARGLWFEQDLEQAERLRSSEKERAENVMIVDMVRNDLGRIAKAGSVRVPALFDVERYPTVWQMTSTVAAETDASLADVMAALFPPASITGAPKASTMGIIAGVECSPRRIYTGTIGISRSRRPRAVQRSHSNGPHQSKDGVCGVRDRRRHRRGLKRATGNGGGGTEVEGAGNTPTGLRPSGNDVVESRRGLSAAGPSCETAHAVRGVLWLQCRFARSSETIGRVGAIEVAPYCQRKRGETPRPDAGVEERRH